MQIRWYKKQALAVEARTDGEIIISQEVTTKGQRRFGCVCEEAFRAQPLSEFGNLHLYEWLDKTKATRLYFDLEHLRQTESGGACPEDDEIVCELITQVRAFLGATHKVEFDDEDVQVLDASNKKKFSRHVHFPVYFRNNHSDMAAWFDDFLAQFSA